MHDALNRAIERTAAMFPHESLSAGTDVQWGVSPVRRAMDTVWLENIFADAAVAASVARSVTTTGAATSSHLISVAEVVKARESEGWGPKMQPAYLVCPPPMWDAMKVMTPLWPGGGDVHGGMNYSAFRNFGVMPIKLYPFRTSVYFSDAWGGGASRYVPRPAVVVETSPAWHLWAVVAFGAWMLCALVNVFG